MEGVILVSNVKRIYPEAKNALINWIEENFHEIDSYVATFTLKDGTTMNVYDCHNVVEAFGILGITQATITELANNGEFVCKPKGDENE